jgi:hypothetical protein
MHLVGFLMIFNNFEGLVLPAVIVFPVDVATESVDGLTNLDFLLKTRRGRVHRRSALPCRGPGIDFRWKILPPWPEINLFLN